MSKHKTKKDAWEDLKKKYPKRIGFEGFFYFKICSEAYTSVERERAELKKLRERRRKGGIGV